MLLFQTVLAPPYLCFEQPFVLQLLDHRAAACNEGRPIYRRNHLTRFLGKGRIHNTSVAEISKRCQVLHTFYGLQLLVQHVYHILSRSLAFLVGFKPELVSLHGNEELYRSLRLIGKRSISYSRMKVDERDNGNLRVPVARSLGQILFSYFKQILTLQRNDAGLKQRPCFSLGRIPVGHINAWDDN
jgi:hypothetical protein